jgi:hypothetical protein
MPAGQLGLQDGAQQLQKYAKTTPLDDGVSSLFLLNLVHIFFNCFSALNL